VPLGGAYPAALSQNAMCLRVMRSHQGTEKVVVLSGKVTLGGTLLEEGDYMFTVPGEEHDVVAVTDAVIFVSSQKATPVIE
jgi:quercetin dioxygenase-like cupin family protein